jgi:hypothetical protein
MRLVCTAICALLLDARPVSADGENTGNPSPPPPPLQPLLPEVLAALEQLYESTSGSSWKRRENWLNGKHPCGRCNDGSVTPDAGCGRKLAKQGHAEAEAGGHDAPASPGDMVCSPANDGSWYGVQRCTLGSGAIASLKLDGNHLTGTIPAALANLGLAGDLILASNELSGTIPSALFSARAVGGLMALDGLRLSGTLPEDLVAAATSPLHPVDGRGSGGSGSGGTSGGSSGGSSIRVERGLTATGNRLSGTLPASLLGGWLVNASILRLDHNQLSGTLPDALGQLTHLSTTLSVAYNPLSGTVPAVVEALQPERCMLLAGSALRRASACESAGPHPARSDAETSCARELRCYPSPSPPPPPLPPFSPQRTPLALLRQDDDDAEAEEAPWLLLPVLLPGLAAAAAAACVCVGWRASDRRIGTLPASCTAIASSVASKTGVVSGVLGDRRHLRTAAAAEEEEREEEERKPLSELEEAAPVSCRAL